MRTIPRVVAALSAVVSTLFVAGPLDGSPPVLAQTVGSLTATKSAPGEVLAGDPVSFTLSASNSGAVPLYNVTFRDELPLGATYVPPSTPSEFGEPEIITNQVPDPLADPLAVPPNTIAQQTLIWSNVADVQPASSVRLSFSVELNAVVDPVRPSLPVYRVGSTITNSATSFASPNERVLARFDGQGLPITDPEVVSASTADTTTRLTAVQIEKSEPSDEGELLRGVHFHSTEYTLQVRTTDLAPVVGATVTDYLPASLEFLGCGQVDNSTVAGGQRPEYLGAPLLSVTPTPADCRLPDVVETVENPPPDGATVHPPGVYTKLTWTVASADTQAGDVLVLRYAAGVPLRANVTFPPGTPASGIQASNLDNNTGEPTREGPTEQAITNVARVSGTYTGPVAEGATTAVSDVDRLTRTIEDVRMRKTIVQPVPNSFRTGALAIYELTVDVGEYVDGSGVVLTDRVPNGMCPISNVAYTSVGGDCGAAFGPDNPTLPSISPPTPAATFGFTSVTPIASGGFTAVFQPLPDTTVTANDTVRVRYSAFMRTRYEGGALDGRPPVSGDSFINTASLAGTTAPLPVSPESGTESVTDGSSATLVSGGATIDKRLRPRQQLPLPAGTPCPTDAASYVDETTVPQPDASDLAFRLGDEICFLLRVDFDPSIRTRNAVVSDFLPLGVEFVPGSLVTTTSNNVVVDVTAPADPDDPIQLDLGEDDPLVAGSDRFVGIDTVMEVVFKAVVVERPNIATPIVTGNLMKMRTENSAGQASSFRDRVPLAIVPPPPMGLTKGVSSVDVPSFSTTDPDRDGITVQQGSVVTYRLDLTNAGTEANLNDYPTQGFDVWDVLPVGITCDDVVPNSIEAFGEDGLTAPIVQCTDPTDGGHPSFSGNTVRSAIRWNLATLPATPGRWRIDAGATEQLTYQVTIPTPTSIGVTFVNDSAIRSYEAFTNQTNIAATYFPSDNIDTGVTPEQENAPAAADPSNVRTPGARTTKSTVTGIEELPNNDRPRVAVPGEAATFTIGVEIPPAVSVFEAVLSDVLPAELELVAPAPVASFYPDATSSTPAPFPDPPPGSNGFVLDTATGALTFPRNPDSTLDTGYSNSTTSTQRFEVVLTARVRPSVGNQVTVTNTARFRSVDRPGGRPVITADATAQNDIRQASPSVVKSNDSNGIVRAGQTVRYTLGARNANGRPPAHDAVVRDCIPDGLAFVTFDPSTPVGSTQGPLPGNPATNGCADTTTFIAFQVGTVQAGTPVSRSYTVTVENTAVGGNAYVNRSAIVASSIDNGVNDAAVERVYRPVEVTNTVRVPAAVASKTVTPNVATVGELVTYTASNLIPNGVNFYQAALRDVLPVGIDPSTLTILDTRCESVPNPVQPSPPPCALTSTLLTPAPVAGGLAVAAYFDDVLAVPYDRVVTIRYRVRLADVPSNVAGADVTNRAQAVWDNNDVVEAPASAGYVWTNQGTVATALVDVVEPSLTIAKTVSDTTPEPGDLFTYTLELTNASGATGSPAYNATLVDDIPIGVDIVPGSFSLPPTSFNPATAVTPGTVTWGPGTIPGPIAPGERLAVTYTARFTESATLSSTAKLNTADLATYEGLPVSEPAGINRRVYTGNDDTASVTPHFPRMETTKQATDGEPTYIDGLYRWTITATNVGTGTARGVSIDDLLPPNWKYVDGSTTITLPGGSILVRNPATASPDVCPTGRLCWLGLGDLAPGQSITLTYLATPTIDVVGAPGIGFPIRHVNTASSDAADATGATGSLAGPYGSPDVTASTRIDAADLVVVKSSPPSTPPVAGQDFSWTIVVSNKSGVDTAVGPFVVTDTLPPAPVPPPPGGWITYDSAGGAGWTCTPGGGAPAATSIGCERNDPTETLAPGDEFEAITVTVGLPSTLPLGTPLTNVASVAGRTHELTPLDNNDSDTVATATQADLQIVKNRTNPTITAGRSTTYTLDVTNLGPSVSRAPITVTDPIPASATLVAIAPHGAWNCPTPTPTPGGAVACTYGADLAVGEVAPRIAVTVLVGSDATGALTNTATVDGTTLDPVDANNTSVDSGPIGVSADLRIQKQSVEATNVAGMPTQYRLRVDNDGPSDAVDLVISDALPAGLAFVSAADDPSEPGGWTCVGANGNQTFNCSLPSLAAGDFAVAMITVAVAPGTIGPVENTATVGSPTPDPNLDNNTDNDVVTVLGEADVAISKTALDTTVNAGETITWTLQVVNNGPSDSVGPIRVADTLPPGVEFVSAVGTDWACPTAPLAVATVTCTRATTLPAATVDAPTQNIAPPITVIVRVLPDAGPGQIDNVAAVTTTTKDPDLGNNVDGETVQVVDLAELSILKQTTGPDPVLAGEATAFTLTVTNDGPSNADSVIVTDVMPSGLEATAAVGDGWTCDLNDGDYVTCQRPTLAPGDAPPIVVTVSVATGVENNTLITNVATVDSATPEMPTADPDSRPNTDSDTVLVLAEADLAITKTHVGPVRIGEELRFTIQVVNNGPSASRRVVVADTLPTGLTPLTATGDGWTCTVVAQQVACALDSLLGFPGSASIAITALVGPRAFPSVTNTVEVGAETDDPNPANNTDDDPVAVPPLVDLTIAKTHAEPVRVGTPIVYTLVVGNNGPIDDPAVITVSDTLPGSLVPLAADSADGDTTCSISGQIVTCEKADGLAVGATFEIAISATVLPSAYPLVVNMASVATPTDDGDPTNNSATEEAAVPPLVDLAITKTHVGPIAVGGRITYTIVTTNNGPTSEPGPIVIDDAVPVGLTPISASGSGLDCTIGGSNVRCTSRGSLGVGESLTLAIVASVGAAAFPSVTNLATVVSPGCAIVPPTTVNAVNNENCRDTNLANNSANDVATVAPLILLQLGKSLASQEGLSATWTFDVRNAGLNQTVDPIVLVDALPPGLMFVSAQGDGWSCTDQVNVVTCTYVAPVGPGASAAPLRLVTLVVAAGGTEIVNTATVAGGGPDAPDATGSGSLVVPASRLPSTGGGPGILVRWAPLSLLLGLAMVIIADRRRSFGALSG